MFDWNSEKGKKLAERLRKEEVIWLTTLRADGTPLPTPVWFLWEGKTILIYTQPGSLKVRNIARNPKAALNLNCDEAGGSVAIFTGELTFEKDESRALNNPAYLQKYRQGISDIQMTPESFSNDFSLALRFHPSRVRSWE